MSARGFGRRGVPLVNVSACELASATTQGHLAAAATSRLKASDAVATIKTRDEFPYAKPSSHPGIPDLFELGESAGVFVRCDVQRRWARSLSPTAEAYNEALGACEEGQLCGIAVPTTSLVVPGAPWSDFREADLTPRKA